MPPKLPACEPCRRSKLACDHAKPVCTRCRVANQANRCKYRDSPFKRRKKKIAENSTDKTESLHVDDLVTQPRKYPNPGWLGTFSHTTLFDHLPGKEDGLLSEMTPGSNVDQNLRPESIVSKANIAYGAKLVEQIYGLLSPSTCYSIIQSWMAKDTNLALASDFVERCAETVLHLLSDRAESHANLVDIASKLFANSCRPLIAAPDDTIDEYSAQFCQQNVRWETLGLFCTALSRAATDLTYAEAFCESDRSRRDLQGLAMHFSDVCLNIAVSLDCLNDIQLLLQYENFILHSMVDGDQSYHSWKRLGDMISSLFALGHHQQLERNPTIPSFLVDLRRAAFARTYSADKNVSIFLGRPPRIHRKYCRFFIPGHNIEIAGRNSLQLHQWNEDVAYDYMFDTQWTAICAVFKEEVLDLLDVEESEERAQRANALHNHVQAQWSAFPHKFRLEGPLKLCNRPPAMRDFLVSARLNHLHILFLLQLVLARSKPKFGTELAVISAEMLGIVIEGVMIKDQLSNSGTTLVWKVAYYGLAAAGAMCLWLLSQSPETRHNGISRSRTVQNLSVLVAELESGTLVQPDDSNYRLLMGASQTIANLLDRLLQGGMTYQTPSTPCENSEGLGVEIQQGWDPWDGATLQDFETDFWLHLAEHPFLLGTESDANLS